MGPSHKKFELITGVYNMKAIILIITWVSVIFDSCSGYGLVVILQRELRKIFILHGIMSNDMNGGLVPSIAGRICHSPERRAWNKHKIKERNIHILIPIINAVLFSDLLLESILWQHKIDSIFSAFPVQKSNSFSLYTKTAVRKFIIFRFAFITLFSRIHLAHEIFYVPQATFLNSQSFADISTRR